MDYNTLGSRGALLHLVAFAVMDWTQRFRMWMDEKELSQDELGSRMRPQMTQGAIGHWLRGRNKIPLPKFFELCRVAGADPQTILFGGDKELRTLERIREVLDSASVTETDPTKTIPPRRDDPKTLPGKARRK